MLDKVIDTYRLKCGSTWEHDFNKSANLIYIRMTSDDLRPFTFEELKEKLSWKTTDIGIHSQTDQTMPSDLSTTSKTLKQEDDTLEESS